MRKTGYQMRKEWEDFHRDHPRVFNLITRYALEGVRRGRKNGSINQIFEVIRWNHEIGTDDQEFKLCNNHRAFYARLFMEEYPQYDGFFRTKPSKGDYCALA